MRARWRELEQSRKTESQEKGDRRMEREKTSGGMLTAVSGRRERVTVSG